jgi:radical SAM protein with 4Fe4S-binding SPASM domain
MKPLYDPREMKRLRQIGGLMHPRFGDLGRIGSVTMPGLSGLHGDYEERPFRFVHLSVTGRCNARCAGCINNMTLGEERGSGGIGKLPETVPERDARAARHLLGGANGKEAVLCLYGGEPLLAMGKVERLCDELFADPDFRPRLMLYTNGKLLSEAVATFAEVMSRIWLFSVSIDGREAQHNSIRIGTDLKAIRSGLRLLKAVRQGPVLMWSTLREGQSLLDCFEEFQSLRKDGCVDHFFWHWIETKEVLHDFGGYAARYEEELRRIMDAYCEALSAGELISVVHINELLLYLLTGRKRRTTGCGVEVEGNYDIMGGRIYTCADMPMASAIGTIEEDGTPLLDKGDLSPFISYKDDLGCYQCGVHAYCGGRCPVQGLSSGAERLIQYCQLMRLHVGTVIDYLPRITEIMARQAMPLRGMYDESAFFAQFTDVTP